MNDWSSADVDTPAADDGGSGDESATACAGAANSGESRAPPTSPRPGADAEAGLVEDDDIDDDDDDDAFDVRIVTSDGAEVEAPEASDPGSPVGAPGG